MSFHFRGFLMAQLGKNPPAIWETWVLSWERGKATLWTEHMLCPWTEHSLPWRRERLPTPVFWPGGFHGLYNPWGCKELDMTERFSLHSHIYGFEGS